MVLVLGNSADAYCAVAQAQSLSQVKWSPPQPPTTRNSTQTFDIQHLLCPTMYKKRHRLTALGLSLLLRGPVLCNQSLRVTNGWNGAFHSCLALRSAQFVSTLTHVIDPHSHAPLGAGQWPRIRTDRFSPRIRTDRNQAHRPSQRYNAPPTRPYCSTPCHICKIPG
jgi:hypothetical protein